MNRRQLIKTIALAAPIAAAAGALATTGPETITLRLRIRDDMSARLRAIAKALPEATRRAMVAEGNRIMAEAKRKHPLPWPVPEGHLLGGARVPYARAIHELPGRKR